MKKVKLAIVCTHPIQYYAPVFRELALSARIAPRVFYTWSQTADGGSFDRDFGAHVAWDIPLLEGYEHEFVENTARDPGVNSFFGVKTPRLMRAIGSWGADAVLVFGWGVYAHLRVLMECKGRLPVLFRGDSTLLDPVKPLRRFARRRFLRWVYSHVDVAIAVGQNSGDYFRWCGLPSERIAFAPHSIDTVRFGDSTGEHDARAMRRRLELGIPAEAIVFLFAGKFTAKKDPRLLLGAFSQLQSEARLVFVGSGELERGMRDAAGEQRNVHFMPFQNQTEMPSAYRLGDLFVMPSRGPGETWGLAMNEAMASGRAVIAGSRVGGARDLIRSGETGWVFESGNEASLVGLLRSAVSLERKGLLEMGAVAQKFIAKWSISEAATGIERAVLKTVLDAGFETESVSA
jgi:glycosyltransferase involved in cell wall biosynthesis